MSRSFIPLSSHLRRFGRFALVGTFGFLVDASVLWLAMHLVGLGIYFGRAVSFATAVTITWLLNRSFTFRDRVPDPRRSEQWLRYLGASVVGAVVNYGVYCVFVVAFDFAARHPTAAVAAGSIAGMLLNFTSYSRLIFRATSEVAGGSTST